MSNSPSLLDAQAGLVLDRINAITTHLASRVTGGVVSDNSSTQGSGANTAPDININVAASDTLISNVPRNNLAATDVDATVGNEIIWGATSGRSIVLAVVAHMAADGVTAVAYTAVPGAVAVTGSQVPPTEAEIDAYMGHKNWTLLGDMTYNRTADTTLTNSFSSARRSSIGNKVTPLGAGPSFTKPLVSDETLWRKNL